MDTYSVKQSALALALSEKRIRQLIEEKKLTAISHSPVTLSQLEVLELRTARAASGRIREANIAKRERVKSRDELLMEQFSLLITKVTEAHQRQLETITHALETEKEAFYKLLNEQAQEIARLKRRSFFHR